MSHLMSDECTKFDGAQIMAQRLPRGKQKHELLTNF
jgi:hypothetical protein